MNRCDEIRAQIAFYLDDELSDEDNFVFESHLRDCAACREVFDQERRLIEGIRSARPLYRAPPGLRAKVQRALDEAALPGSSSTPGNGKVPKTRLMIRGAVSRLAQNRYVRAGFGALVMALVGVWAVTEGRRYGLWQSPSEFAQMAVDSHQRYLRGQLPLELASEAPEAISAWFEGKLPFQLTLPNYQESSGQEPVYRLEGARLVGFKADYAAFVAYRMAMRPISLLVTSSVLAAPSGGETIALRGLVFHYDTIAGLKVISWSDRGLTYALVSNLEERGQQSCVVCHQGTRDRNFIEQLRP